MPKAKKKSMERSRKYGRHSQVQWTQCREEGRSLAEVEGKKKWFDLKCETKKNIAKFRRETQRTGGTADIKSLSELDQRLGAIIGETALSGVPSAECLDTDLGPEATLSPPPCASSAPEESEGYFLE
ncbi:hypothetical protein D4764_17G0007530 [Takifugu flavidus]|uniref:Uncharacterized protein n=1 Tax=Takifugu flavidus TaxID=433684 RepID=A0A5C6NZK0_9TELE|nr:hypothetical protein D4764_17G0007530 [Takifugu flavidus]